MATISIADNDARIQHSIGSSGNTANSTTFTIDFPFFALDDINVIITNSSGVDTTLTRGSGANTFAVTGTAVDDGFSGGNITLGSAYTSSTVTIFRDIPVTRTTDFATSGPFNIASLNTELDRIIAIEQELETDISRTLKLPDSDGTVSTTLPNIDTRKGKTLAFNASTGAVEAGPTISGVTTVSAMAADIAALADIEDGTTATDAISGLAAIKTDVTAVANIATAVSAVNSNSTNINAVNSNSSNINTLAGSISNVNAVGAKASLITSDFVSDLNTLAVTDVINDINTLATSDIVSDLNTLATSDIVSDLNTLATSDIVSDINTLATSDIVTDLNLLATSDFVSDLNTVATSGNVTAVNNVSGAIANVNIVANNLTSVNSFGNQYEISATAPSSPNEGLLWFDTTNDIMKVYDGSGFVNAGSSVNGTANRFAWTVGTSSGSYNGSTTVFPGTYDAGYVDVFLNGVKLLVGTDVTATNGSSVTLASAAATADIVEIVAYGTFTAATELSLLDNKKIQLGTSQDLQLYWDGTDGHIDVAGTLNIDGSGETLAKFIDDGAVELYHNNVKKIETTATGVDVTGGITTTTASSIEGGAVFNEASADVDFRIESDANTHAFFLEGSTGNAGIGTGVLVNPLHVALTPNTASKTSGSAFDDGAVRLEGNLSATDSEVGILVGNNDSLSAGIGFARENSATWGTQLRFYNHSPSVTTTDELTERMRIDASGRLGLGTASPSAGFRTSIKGDYSSIIGGIEFDSGGGDKFTIGHASATSPSGTINVVGAGNLIFKTTDTERMRLTAAGKLCIGTTSAVSNAMLNIVPADTNRIINTRNFQNGSQHHHVFQSSSSSTIGTITCSNTATAYNTSSDYRLKTSLEYDWDATTRLKQLKPARFKWVADGDDAVSVDGFLAHEVQEIVPEAISGTKDAMRDEQYEVSPATGDIYTPAAEATFGDDGNEVSEATDEVIHNTNAEKPEELAEGQQWRETTAAKMGTRSVPDLQGIDQSKLVPLLCKTILELEARITALEAAE